MQNRAAAPQRKRRSSRAVVAGIGLVGSSLVVSTWEMVHPGVTTAGTIVGFLVLVCGVRLGWVGCSRRDADGPAN